MNRRAFLTVIMALAVLYAFAFTGLAAEKLRYGLTMKYAMSYAVPPIAAEEKGFWKQEGLEVEVVGFRGTHETILATVGKQIDMGTIETMGAVLAGSAGAALAVVSSMNQEIWWSLYVRTDSPYKKAEELKGKKLSLTSLHDVSGAYGRFLNKVLGLNLKLVGTGGLVERLAALKAGAVDATVSPPGGVAPLLVKGELREVLNIDDYAPKPFQEYHIYARKDTVDNSPEIVRKGVRGMLKTMNFLGENRRWAMEKMKEAFRFNEAEAELQYDINFKGVGGQGAIDARRLENVKNFMVEYGLIAKEKAPRMDLLHTNRFVQ